MKKAIIAVTLLGFCLVAFVHAESEGPFGEQITLESKLVNKKLEKQLKILEKIMYKKGAGPGEIIEAKRACIRMNEAGLTPKKARKMIAKEVKKSLKQGIKGEALGKRLQSMAQSRVQERIREGEGEKVQTRERLREGTGEEAKEQVRKSMPEGKGPEGTGGGSDRRKGR